jgi:arsenate reductase
MAKTLTIYGIKNCDTMKKARAWLDKAGKAYAFHDYKTAGIDRARLEGWANKVGWEALITGQVPPSASCRTPPRRA